MKKKALDENAAADAQEKKSHHQNNRRSLPGLSAKVVPARVQRRDLLPSLEERHHQPAPREPALRDAVKELKLRLGHSPLFRVVEVDPWSRIPERRHALLSFDP